MAEESATPLPFWAEYVVVTDASMKEVSSQAFWGEPSSCVATRLEGLPTKPYFSFAAIVARVVTAAPPNSTPVGR